MCVCVCVCETAKLSDASSLVPFNRVPVSLNVQRRLLRFSKSSVHAFQPPSPRPPTSWRREESPRRRNRAAKCVTTGLPRYVRHAHTDTHTHTRAHRTGKRSCKRKRPDDSARRCSSRWLLTIPRRVSPWLTRGLKVPFSSRVLAAKCIDLFCRKKICTCIYRLRVKSLFLSSAARVSIVRAYVISEMI